MYFDSKPSSSHLYTEIFTSECESGRYVRERLRDNSPAIWKKVSKQLYDLGYHFPEMNEAVSGEFPSALISDYFGETI